MTGILASGVLTANSTENLHGCLPLTLIPEILSGGSEYKCLIVMQPDNTRLSF